jgi:hypothetical protein
MSASESEDVDDVDELEDDVQEEAVNETAATAAAAPAPCGGCGSAPTDPLFSLVDELLWFFNRAVVVGAGLALGAVIAIGGLSIPSLV